MTRIIGAYEVISHGIEHLQYFQGCGVSHTEFTNVATGVGDTAKEAFEDALDQLAQNDWETDTIARAAASNAAQWFGADLEEAHRACVEQHTQAGESNAIPFDEWHDECELSHFVSIRVRAQTLGEYLDAHKGSGTLYRIPQYWKEQGETVEECDWDHLEGCGAKEADLYQIPYTVAGDYTSSGPLCSVERSNARVFKESFPEALTLYGSYGASCVVLPTSHPMTSELVEALEGLENYPLLDEDDHSELEQSQIMEDWDSWARSDFRAALAKAFREEGENERAALWIEDMPNEALDKLYWDACESQGKYGEPGYMGESYPEHGGSEIDFKIDGAVAKIGEADLPPFPEMPIETGCADHKPRPAFGCPECTALRDAFEPYMEKEGR